MSRWVYIALAYGLAGLVLGGYTLHLLLSLKRFRRQMEGLLKRHGPDRVEEAA